MKKYTKTTPRRKQTACGRDRITAKNKRHETQWNVFERKTGQLEYVHETLQHCKMFWTCDIILKWCLVERAHPREWTALSKASSMLSEQQSISFITTICHMQLCICHTLSKNNIHYKIKYIRINWWENQQFNTPIKTNAMLENLANNGH